MDVSLVHDFLTQRGGAERVALEFARLFPGAPLFTSIYDGDGTYPEFRELDVRVTWLQGKVRPGAFRLAALCYPTAFRSLDLFDAGQVLVSSSAFAHHVRHPNAYVYCHTPPRFLYDPSAYQRMGTLASAAQPLLANVRRNDRVAAWRARSYAANSRATAQRIEEVYGISARVIHPPLTTGHLPREAEPAPAVPRALMVARLQPYKRVDLAIMACQRVGVPLTVVGDGPDAASLRALGGDTVTMLGRVDDATLAELFRTHSVILAPGREDFGYAPIEANYAGRPVVARSEGGFVETVVDGVTGVLVDSEDAGAWSAALESALARSWDPAALRASTVKYQVPAFRAALLDWLGLPAGPSTGNDHGSDRSGGFAGSATGSGWGPSVPPPAQPRPTGKSSPVI